MSIESGPSLSSGENREETAAEGGLPEDVKEAYETFKKERPEICKKADDFLEKVAAEKAEEDAIWKGINTSLSEIFSEDYRKKIAVKKGLPENASWEEIKEVSRKKAAIKRGLPENATWEEIGAFDIETSRKRSELRDFSEPRE